MQWPTRSACLHTRQDQNELHLRRWFFVPKSATTVSRSQAHLAKRCSSVYTIIFDRRKDKTNYLSNQRAALSVVWPPRCCDLTPLDYYLWGAVRDKCYAIKPETIDALKVKYSEIRIGEIQLHTIDNVLKNWTDRLGYCMASRGSHLNEIIFHY